MASEEFFIGSEVGIENVGFAIAGREEELCGRDQKDLSYYYLIAV